MIEFFLFVVRFFRQSRRRIGIVVLAMAVPVTFAWIMDLTRSNDARKSLQGASRKSHANFREHSRSYRWFHEGTHPHFTTSDLSNVISESDIQKVIEDNRFLGIGRIVFEDTTSKVFVVDVLPCWIFVLPLVSLSAWLLLSKLPPPQPPRYLPHTTNPTVPEPRSAGDPITMQSSEIKSRLNKIRRSWHKRGHERPGATTE